MFVFKVGVQAGYRFESTYFSDFESAKENGLKKWAELVCYEKGLELVEPTEYDQFVEEDGDISIVMYHNGIRLGYVMITPFKIGEW